MAVVDFPTSPAVGQQYVFGDITWTWDGVKWTAYPGSLSIPDAPSDGQLYGRKFVSGSMSWAAGGGGGISDAPTDGTLYARKSGAWVHPLHSDIPDWAATLAPYALTSSVPVASTTTPLGDGTAAVGTGTTWARADHVHPVVFMGENRLINGDMRIDQRNGGVFGNNANDWPVDRWHFVGVNGGDMSWGRNLNNAVSAPGFPNYLGFQTTSVGAVGPSAAYYVYQPIEADMVSDLAWGQAGAQPVTLSFWVQSSLTGTFSGTVGTRLLSGAGATAYPFTFTISAANTWEKKTVNIPVPTSGTWVQGGNAASMVALFSLGAGVSVSGAANTWITQAGAGAVYGATGAVSLKNTNNATFYVTGIKQEAGSVATPFNRQSLAKVFADCQRYYQRLGSTFFDLKVAGYVTALGDSVSVTFAYPPMRAVPTATAVGTFATNNLNAPALLLPGTQTMGVQLTGAALGHVAWTNDTGAQYITLNAEL